MCCAVQLSRPTNAFYERGLCIANGAFEVGGVAKEKEAEIVRERDGDRVQVWVIVTKRTRFP